MVEDTERPYSSPPLRSHEPRSRSQERRSRSRERDSVIVRGSSPRNSNGSNHGDKISTDKEIPKPPGDLATARSTLTLSDSDPGSRSSQGHKFRNKVLPLYGDIDSLLPPHQYPDQPFNLTTRIGATHLDQPVRIGATHLDQPVRIGATQGQTTTEVSDNLVNDAKTATTNYTASINSEYVMKHDDDNPSQTDDESKDYLISNKLEREYLTISDFSSVTHDTSPLVKSDMKRSLTETELRHTDSYTRGFENPVFSYSCSIDSTCTDPTPVKRYRSDTGILFL